MTDDKFDVFLSHNSEDKPAVRDLKQRLLVYQNSSGDPIKIWYDEDELQPGLPWQQRLESGIKNSISVAVLIGISGLGPWEDEEMQGALRLAVKSKGPVIPVLLPGAPAQPELPMFLGNRTWVDLRSGVTDDGLEKLVWGITGKKPSRLPPTKLPSKLESLDKTSRLTTTAKPKSTFTYVAFRHKGVVFALMGVASLLALSVAWQFGFLNVREIASRKDAPSDTPKTNLNEFSLDRSSEQNETPLPPPPDSIPGPYKAGLHLINDDDRTKKDFLETTITVVNETNSDIHLSFDYIPRESYEQDSTYAHRVTDTIPARTTTGLRELNFGGPYHLSVLAFGTWYPENVWVDLKITANRTVVVTESGGRFQCAVIFDRPIK